MDMKIPRVSPELLALVGEGFFSRLAFGIISFALPLYAYTLGMSLTSIGFMLSLTAVAEVSLKPFMSRLVDRFGYKLSLSLAIAGRSSLALILVFSDAPWQLCGIRLLHGMIESLRDPALNSMLAESGGEKSVASAFSWYSTARYTASAIGKTAAGLLLGWTAANYKFVFLCSFALSLLSFYVVLRYTRERPRPAPPEKPAPAPEAAPPGAQAASPGFPVLVFAGFGFLITSTGAMLNSLFPLLATQYAGLTKPQAGLVFGVSTVLMLISGPVFGWLSDNVSRKLVLLIRGAANTLSSLLYLFFLGLAGIAIGKVADDMGKAAFRPAWGALMAKVSGVSRARRAQTIGTLTIGENLGDMLGPALGGFLWSTHGVAALLIARAVLASTAELYAIFIVDPRITASGELAVKPGSSGEAVTPGAV